MFSSSTDEDIIFIFRKLLLAQKCCLVFFYSVQLESEEVQHEAGKTFNKVSQFITSLPVTHNTSFITGHVIYIRLRLNVNQKVLLLGYFQPSVSC